VQQRRGNREGAGAQRLKGAVAHERKTYNVSVADVPEAVDLAALVGRVAAGETEAEGTLVEHFLPRVRVMMLARTRDADVARDLTQDTLVAVLQAARRGQIREPERIAAFVHGVARNLANNHARGVRAQAEAPLEALPAEPFVEDDHERRERQALLVQGLEAIGEADRHILQLTLVDGMKPGEIAEQLGLTSEVVRARKSRARRRVVEALAGLSRIVVRQPL
jgi:RNA polymerase sigma-70 factor, ECF subfamily